MSDSREKSLLEEERQEKKRAKDLPYALSELIDIVVELTLEDLAAGEQNNNYKRDK